MILRFVEGGGWDSSVIRWDTRCRWSHVEAVHDNRTFGAMLDGGVCWRSMRDPVYRNVVRTHHLLLDVNKFIDFAFWKFLTAQNGKPYDWRAIASFGLGSREWRGENSWFCSELQSRALEVVGLLVVPKDVPVCRITPRDLWMMLAGRKQCATIPIS